MSLSVFASPVFNDVGVPLALGTAPAAGGMLLRSQLSVQCRAG